MEILQNIMLLFCGQCLNMIIFRKEIFGKKEDEELKKEIYFLKGILKEVIEVKCAGDFSNFLHKYDFVLKELRK